MGRDTGLIVGASVLAVCMLGGTAWWFLFASGGEGSRPPTVAPTTSATPAPTVASPTPLVTTTPAPTVTAPPRAYWPAPELGAFDPTRFDADAFLPTALADARKVWKDARLVWLSAVSVGADGVSDLTTSFSSSTAVSYAFRSTTAKDAGASCVHFVYVDQKGAWSETIDFPRLCKLPLAALKLERRCKLVDAFARVGTKYTIRAGRADVLLWTSEDYREGDTRADWEVSGFPIVDADSESNLSWGFPDDCAQAGAKPSGP